MFAKHPGRVLDDAFSLVEAGANQAATGANDIPHPTEAQAIAGNYRMGTVRLFDLPVIRIENVRGSYREGTAPDGTQWRTRLAAHYGYFAGTRGADGDAIDVFVGPFPESTSAWVINQRHVGEKPGFDEHKCMVGFHTEQQARDAYTHSFDRGWTGLASIVPASINQLKWWLKFGNHKQAITAETLPFDGENTMLDKVLWDSNAQPVTTPMHRLMYDLRVSDAGTDLMLDACTMQDLMGGPDIESVPVYDALVVEVASMTRKMNLLQKTMETAGVTVKPTEMTIADPVKSRGVLQVMVLFSMSDGQTVSIWFHNPDTTPAKLTPMDELISWKWMINKKDVTIVVAPERGTDLNVREVSRRVMRLVEKNSEAFQKANAKAGERAAVTEALKTEIGVLEGTLSGLQRQIEVAKVAKDDAAAGVSRKITDLIAKQDAAFKLMEAEKAFGAGADTVKLEEFMNQYDDLADQIRALRGEEATGRTSWATWQELRANEAARNLPAKTMAARLADALAVLGWTYEAVQDGYAVSKGITELVLRPYDRGNNQKGIDITGSNVSFMAGDDIQKTAFAINREEWLSASDYVTDDGETITDEDSPLFGKTIEFAQAFDSITDAVKTVGGTLLWGDFNATLRNGSLIDSATDVPTHFGVSAQFGLGGVVCGRAAISESGEVTVYTGADGEDVASRSSNPTEYSSVIVGILKAARSTNVATEIDPTTPDGYHKVWGGGGNQVLKEKYQDTLDPLLSSRMMAVRSALQDLGWSDGSPGTGSANMMRNGASLVTNIEHVGAGRNVVGIIYCVTGNIKSTAEGNELRDDLSVTPDELAAELDANVALPQEDQASNPIAIVDAAYKFDNATNAFKEWVADSVAEVDYSPFASAMRMDKKANELGASVAWDVSFATLDSAAGDDEGDDFDPQVEFDSAPEMNEEGKEVEPVMDGDFRGHPFRGNQYKKAARASGTAVNASIRAKSTERRGDAQSAAKAHETAHHAHKAAGVEATGKAKKYHKIMAAFHGSRAGLKLDSVLESEAPAFPWMLDDASEFPGTVIGVIVKDGVTAGRAHIGGDGKAMVFVGAKGVERIQFPSGRKAMWSDDDADLMIETLLVTPKDREDMNKPATGDTDVSRLNAAEALVSKDAILSDDPRAIEKLDAKLTALRMRQEFMKKANKFFKKGDDAGLLAMGLTQVQINKMKAGDYAGRIGFADYLLTNNNGVMASTRKRMDALIAAKQKEAAVAGNETRDPRDVASDPEGLAIVEPGAPVAAAETTPPAEVDPIKAIDTAYLETFTNGTADMFATDILERLEPMFTKYENDAPMMDLLNRAAEAYSDAAMKAAQAALAG